MTIPRTSHSHPLRIAAVTPGGGHGRIGITLCPGKTDPAGLTGAWARNLHLDLDAVADWGATAVVSLITDQELDHLAVRDLPGAVRDRHMEWWHLPIPDGAPPGPDFENTSMALALADSLAATGRDAIDCRDLMEAVDACRAFAALLADAIAGSPRAELLAPRTFDGAPAIARILAGSWRARARDTIRSSGYDIHTLEAAIWSVARTADFRGAVLLATNLADDADTVAAVTGQLAGAIHGLSGIPEPWLARVAWRDRLVEAAQRLLPPSRPTPGQGLPTTSGT